MSADHGNGESAHVTKVKFEKKNSDDEDVVLMSGSSPKSQKSAKEKDARALEARQLLGQMKEEDPAESRIALKIYKRRWLVLIVVAMLNNSNTMSWIAFAPIANYVDEFYGTENAANWFSLIYMLCTVPVGIFAMWAGGRFGLRTAVLIAGWTNGIGALIRLSSSFLPMAARFPVGLTGQALAAIAYPFIMFLPTKVAASWFPDNQRAIATTVGIMSNPLGVLFANVISPNLVTATHHVVYLNILTAVPSVIVCLLATLGVTRSEPKIPPSQSASEKEMGFIPGLKACLENKAYLILLLVMGGGIGMFNCLYTVMQQLLCPSGYTNSFSGLCAALMIVGGLIGATASGMFVDRTKLYEETMKVAMAVAVVFGIIFMQLTFHPGLAVPIAIFCFIFGVLGLATYPVGLEMSAECTFPVATTTSTGLIVICGQIQSVIYVALLKTLAKPLKFDRQHLQICSLPGQAVKADDMRLALTVFSGIATALVLILVVFFKPIYKRLIAEGKLPPADGKKKKGSAKKDLDATQLQEKSLKDSKTKSPEEGNELKPVIPVATSISLQQQQLDSSAEDADDRAAAITGSANDSMIPLIQGSPAGEPVVKT